MKAKNLLPTEATEILTEESVKQIESAFTNKLQLTVEAALAEQDDLYATKLQQLINAIDKDHTSKLKRVVEAIDKNNAAKLVKVVKRYDRELTNEASSFKTTLVESISNYLEEFLDETIPAEAISEATKNRTAMLVLSNLRNVLAVDSGLVNESFQAGIMDAKNQIEKLTAQVNTLSKENGLLKEGYSTVKAALVLESKTASLPDKKKAYIKRVLGDKSAKFIEENFDYTLRLFDKKENERIEMIKEQAFETRKVKADAPMLTEAAKVPSKQEFNPYISELRKYK
jgi:hypothetical protein